MFNLLVVHRVIMSSSHAFLYLFSTGNRTLLVFLQVTEETLQKLGKAKTEWWESWGGGHSEQGPTPGTDVG